MRFRYYDAEVHRAAFTLPVFQREGLAEQLTPFRTAD